MPESFDDQYTQTGARCLRLLEAIREIITDMPADESCGAQDDDLAKLEAIKSKLWETYRYL